MQVWTVRYRSKNLSSDNYAVQVSDKTHVATVVIYCAPFGMLNKPGQHDDKVSAVTALILRRLKVLGSQGATKSNVGRHQVSVA
jgi:hypothetical protein